MTNHARVRGPATDSLQGIRALAMMSVLLLAGCRRSVVTNAYVGLLETDGFGHYLHVVKSGIAGGEKSCSTPPGQSGPT